MQTNGNFETLAQLNVSTAAFIVAADEVIYDVYISNVIFIVCSVVLLIVCAGIAAIPLVVMERQRRELWEAIFQAPVETV